MASAWRLPPGLRPENRGISGHGRVMSTRALPGAALLVSAYPLMTARTHREFRLIELKRPSLKIGRRETDQLEDYANVIFVGCKTDRPIQIGPERRLRANCGPWRPTGKKPFNFAPHAVAQHSRHAARRQHIMPNASSRGTFLLRNKSKPQAAVSFQRLAACRSHRRSAATRAAQTSEAATKVARRNCATSTLSLVSAAVRT